MPVRQLRGQLVEHADVFALDLHKALVEQLPMALSVLHRAPLTVENLADLGEERGVYQLFEHGQPRYVGKSEEPLAVRLDQHRRRCRGRLNIDVQDISFRCLYVDTFVDAAAPERMLIADYQRKGLAPWNYEVGFAPKDVGHQRDGGKPGQWFLDHPVRYEAPLTLANSERRVPLLSALGMLKAQVPFDLFRFASHRSGDRRDAAAAKTDYPGRCVDIKPGPASVLEHVRRVVEQLPPGWQATVLPQGVILYKENRDYSYALAGWRRTATDVEELGPGSHWT